MMSNEGRYADCPAQAAGFSYCQDKANGAIVVQLASVPVTVAARGPFVKDILGQIYSPSARLRTVGIRKRTAWASPCFSRSPLIRASNFQTRRQEKDAS